MSLEGRINDKKSIRAVTGKFADLPELANEGVAFAKAQRWRNWCGLAWL